MRRFCVGLAAFGLVTVGVSAQASNLVVNGNFTQLTNGLGQVDSNTQATGWTSTGGYNFVMAQADQAVQGIYGGVSLWDQNNGGANGWNGLAANGGNFLAMDGDYYTVPVEQTIHDLVVGKTYTLTFDYAFGQQESYGGATIQSLTGSIGGTNFDTGNVNVSDHGFTGWTQEKVKFTADSTSELLSFLAHGNLPVPPFAMISNVSIPSAVPEPGVWAMMILGIGGLGAMARRRRKIQGAAAA
jgi:hypothetical protein